MIRLTDLLEDSYEPGDVWKLKRGYRRWAAKGASGKRRYFKTEKAARAFAAGGGSGGKAGTPEPKIKPEKREEKQTYDN